MSYLYTIQLYVLNLMTAIKNVLNGERFRGMSASYITTFYYVAIGCFAMRYFLRTCVIRIYSPSGVNFANNLLFAQDVSLWERAPKGLSVQNNGINQAGWFYIPGYFRKHWIVLGLYENSHIFTFPESATSQPYDISTRYVVKIYYL